MTTPEGSDGLVDAAPAVTWLVCCHRIDEWVRDSLASCLAQTFTRFELLVVANGPAANVVRDTVAAWFADEPRLRIECTPVQQLTFSLSYGVHLARAPLIARMDADDLARPDRLARQVAHMSEHPEDTVVGMWYERIDKCGHPIDRIELPTEDRAIRRALVFRNPLCHPSVMFRRDAVLAFGGYVGGMFAEDYDLWIRMSRDPLIRFRNLPHVGVGYRVADSAGPSRSSRLAYGAVAGSQMCEFVSGRGGRWLLGTAATAMRSFTRGRPA